MEPGKHPHHRVQLKVGLESGVHLFRHRGLRARCLPDEPRGAGRLQDGIRYPARVSERKKRRRAPQKFPVKPRWLRIKNTDAWGTLRKESPLRLVYMFSEHRILTPKSILCIFG